MVVELMVQSHPAATPHRLPPCVPCGWPGKTGVGVVEGVDRRVALPALAEEDVVIVLQVVVGLDGELVFQAVVGIVEAVSGVVQAVADGVVVGEG